MYKYLFALVMITGSFATYAELPTDSRAIDNSSRSSVGDTYYGDEYYEDEASSYQSATSRADQYDNPAAGDMDSTVTGTMPDFSREGLIAQKWHAGVMSGVNSSSENAIDSTPSFGIDVGYQPAEHFGAGLEAFTQKQDDQNDFQRTTALMKGTYHLGGDIPVLNTAYVGGGVGPVFISNKVRWAGAPMVGFDVPLSTKTSDFLSLGLNAKYIFTTNNVDTPREFASALALKYWF